MIVRIQENKTNILKVFDGVLENKPNAYVVSTCYSTDDNKVVGKFEHFKPHRKIWLQHSKIINRGLYWCAVISKKQYNSVGGLDEIYAEGFGREDVDFVRTLRKNGVEIIARDDALVIHQNHPDCSPRKKQLWERNALCFAKKWSSK